MSNPAPPALAAGHHNTTITQPRHGALRAEATVTPPQGVATARHPGRNKRLVWEEGWAAGLTINSLISAGTFFVKKIIVLP